MLLDSMEVEEWFSFQQQQLSQIDEDWAARETIQGTIDNLVEATKE